MGISIKEVNAIFEMMERKGFEGVLRRSNDRVWRRFHRENYTCSGIITFSVEEPIEDRVIILGPEGDDETVFSIGTMNGTRASKIFTFSRKVKEGLFAMKLPEWMCSVFLVAKESGAIRRSGLGRTKITSPNLNLIWVREMYVKREEVRHLDLYRCPSQC